jgi:hypothetical protein
MPRSRKKGPAMRGRLAAEPPLLAAPTATAEPPMEEQVALWKTAEPEVDLTNQTEVEPEIPPQCLEDALNHRTPRKRNRYKEEPDAASLAQAAANAENAKPERRTTRLTGQTKPKQGHLTDQTKRHTESPSPKTKTPRLTSQINRHVNEAKQAAKEHQEAILAGHTRHEALSYGVAQGAYRLVLDFAEDPDAGLEYIKASRVKPRRAGTNQHWQLVGTLYADDEGKVNDKVLWNVTAISKVTLECKRRALDMDRFRETLKAEGGFTGFYKKNCRMRRNSSKASTLQEINEDMAAIEERIEEAEANEYIVSENTVMHDLLRGIEPGLAIVLINIDEDGDYMPLGVSLLPRETKQNSWIVKNFLGAATKLRRSKKVA